MFLVKLYLTILVLVIGDDCNIQYVLLHMIKPTGDMSGCSSSLS